MKNCQKVSTVDRIIQKDRSVIWKTEQQTSPKLSRKKEKKDFKKQQQFKRLLRQHQVYSLSCYRGSRRRKLREKRRDFFEEILAENFPNLEKEINTLLQEAQRISNKMNPNRSTPRHIKIKMTVIKDKERILKAAREKQLVMYYTRELP